MKGSCFWVRILTVCTLLIGLGAFTGCETGQTGARTDSKIGTDPGVIQTDTTYHPGDKITVEFDNGLPNPWIQIVREDGSIGLPLNKSVGAAGKHKADLEEDIRKVYVPTYLNRLTVNIRSEDRSYFV